MNWPKSYILSNAATLSSWGSGVMLLLTCCYALVLLHDLQTLRDGLPVTAAHFGAAVIVFMQVRFGRVMHKALASCFGLVIAQLCGEAGRESAGATRGNG